MSSRSVFRTIGRLTFTRTGRTARAGKTGEGWVFIHPSQIKSLSDKCHGMPVNQDKQTLQTSLVDMTKDLESAPPAARNAIELINTAMTKVDANLKFVTFRAQLGSTLQTFDNKRNAIIILNRLAVHGYRLAEPPALSSALVKNLGLRRIPEVNVDDSRSFGAPRGDSYESRSGGFGDRGSRSFGGDRGSRSSGGDRGSRSFGRDRERSYGGDRGSRSFGRDRDSRSFGRDREPRSFGRDRESRGDREERGFPSRFFE
ncbi:ATP-dependent RNA helicase [Penicillium tannophilum]|nr:ATP-dependent RNA helicase [Penicillium tannophilum]